MTPTAKDVAHPTVQVDWVDHRAGTDRVRRTVVRRSRASVAAAGRRVARDVALMIDDAVDLSPSPSPERCPTCPFLAPCNIMEDGRDPEFMLLTDYRPRGEEELEDAGLRRSDERREQQGSRFGHEENVNFRWS